MNEPRFQKRTLFLIAYLVFAGPVDQFIEDGELHRRHVKTGRFFHEKCHGALVCAPDKVAWRLIEIEALCHGRECSLPPADTPAPWHTAAERGRAARRYHHSPPRQRPRTIDKVLQET